MKYHNILQIKNPFKLLYNSTISNEMGEITSEPNLDPDQMKSDHCQNHAKIPYDVKIALIVILSAIFFIGIFLNIPEIKKMKKV